MTAHCPFRSGLIDGPYPSWLSNGQLASQVHTMYELVRKRYQIQLLQLGVSCSQDRGTMRLPTCRALQGHLVRLRPVKPPPRTHWDRGQVCAPHNASPWMLQRSQARFQPKPRPAHSDVGRRGAAAEAGHPYPRVALPRYPTKVGLNRHKWVQVATTEVTRRCQ